MTTRPDSTGWKHSYFSFWSLSIAMKSGSDFVHEVSTYMSINLFIPLWAVSPANTRKNSLQQRPNLSCWEPITEMNFAKKCHLVQWSSGVLLTFRNISTIFVLESRWVNTINYIARPDLMTMSYLRPVMWLFIWKLSLRFLPKFAWT